MYLCECILLHSSEHDLVEPDHRGWEHRFRIRRQVCTEEVDVEISLPFIWAHRIFGCFPCVSHCRDAVGLHLFDQRAIYLSQRPWYHRQREWRVVHLKPWCGRSKVKVR